MKPWISLMPRSVYWPLRAHVPLAHRAVGAGHRIGTAHDTDHQVARFEGTAWTRIDDAGPGIRAPAPGGSCPAAPSRISPRRSRRLSRRRRPPLLQRRPSLTSGSGNSSYIAEPGCFGSTVIAFTEWSPFLVDLQIFVKSVGTSGSRRDTKREAHEVGRLFFQTVASSTIRALHAFA